MCLPPCGSYVVRIHPNMKSTVSSKSAAYGTSVPNKCQIGTEVPEGPKLRILCLHKSWPYKIHKEIDKCFPDPKFTRESDSEAPKISKLSPGICGACLSIISRREYGIGFFWIGSAVGVGLVGAAQSRVGRGSVKQGVQVWSGLVPSGRIMPASLLPKAWPGDHGSPPQAGRGPWLDP